MGKFERGNGAVLRNVEGESGISPTKTDEPVKLLFWMVG